MRSKMSTATLAERAPAAVRETSRTATFFGDYRRRSAAFGQAMTWLCGGALAFNLLLVIGIMALLAYHGLGYFWQRDLAELTLKDGRKVLGEVWEIEKAPGIDRLRMKIGNRDVGGLDFAWIDAKDVSR